MARGSKYLLGMNEPSARKNESALAVAERWREVEALAASASAPVKIVSAAPGGLDLPKAERWLREFFGVCHGCRVDAVAVHFYECDGSTETSAAASAAHMMAFLDHIYRSYHKPVWLTEWNCGDGAAEQNPKANQSAGNHLRFMRAALPLLEAAPHVARYAWFQTWQRHSPWHPGNNPGCSLVSQDGRSLTPLGRFYDTYEP